MVAVYFRIPDDTRVTVGHYSASPEQATAAQAVARFLSLSPEEVRGYEVFLPRGVNAKEIRRIRSLRRPVGWRYMPNAHGRKPCPCPACLNPGEYGAAKLCMRSPDYNGSAVRPRQQVLADLATATFAGEIVDLLYSLQARGHGDVFRIAHLADHPDARVREALAYTLTGFHPKAAAELLEKLRGDPVKDVREAAGAEED